MVDKLPSWFMRLPVLPAWLLMTGAALVGTFSLLSLLDIYETPYRLHSWGFIVWMLLLFRAAAADERSSLG